MKKDGAHTERALIKPKSYSCLLYEVHMVLCKLLKHQEKKRNFLNFACSAFSVNTGPVHTRHQHFGWTDHRKTAQSTEHVIDAMTSGPSYHNIRDQRGLKAKCGLFELKCSTHLFEQGSEILSWVANPKTCRQSGPSAIRWPQMNMNAWRWEGTGPLTNTISQTQYRAESS